MHFAAPPLPARDRRFAPSPIAICQLAGTWSGALPPGQWKAEEKVDGIRCLWIDGALYTREGVALDLPAIAAELRELERRIGRRMFFDGEYQEAGGFLDTLAWLQSRGRREPAGALHLFDAVPLEDWRADACPAPLRERRRVLLRALWAWSPQHLRRVLPEPVAGAQDVERLAREAWARGSEGLMLKRADSLYRRRRSGDWLKVKRELRLSGTVKEVLGDGSTVAMEIGGRRVRVAVPPSLRGTPAVEMTAQVAAMEWTATGALRHGRIVGIGRD